MLSELLYTALVALVALQRLGELVVSRRNVARLRARGGIEYGAGHYPWMVALHVGFLVSCVAEVWLLHRPFRPVVAVAMVLVLALGMAVRFWSLHTLGDRWMTRVMVVPGESVVVSGPYRYLSHPNYLAVVLEIAAIPLIHGAWITAIVFSILNGVMLAIRISVEERALRRHTGWAERGDGTEVAS